VPNLTAGLIAGPLVIISSVSYAMLIFTGELAPYLSVGIGVALFGAIILSVVTALTSSLPTISTVPQDNPAVLLALITASLTSQFQSSGSPAALLPTVIALLGVASVATGLCFLGLGVFGLGKLVRIIPYPVIGGFLAGTGWLIVKGSMGVMAGSSLRPNTLSALFQGEFLARWVPSVLYAGALLVAARRFRSYLTMPAMLVGAIGVFYLGLWLAGASIAQASTQGWLLGPLPSRGLWPPLRLAELMQVHWTVVAGQISPLLALILISTVSLLFNAAGVELATSRDLDVDRELWATGVANVVAGLGGSLPGYISLSKSVLSHQIGADSRLVGLFSALVCGATLFHGASVLRYVPRPIIGGLLLFTGLTVLLEWVVVARRKLPPVDYALVLLILGVIATVGFLQGVGVGLVVAISLFLIKYSRTPVVKHVLTGATYQSNVERPASQQRLLLEWGDQVYILTLQGYLFFGTTNSLLTHVRARVQDPARARVRFLVLDFRSVSGMDSSAAFSFIRLRQLAEAQHVLLVFTSLMPALQHQLENSGFPPLPDALCRLFSNLDYGLEWCENHLLADVDGAVSQPLPLAQQLMNRLLVPVDTATLMQYFEPLHLPAGEALVRQEDSADALYWIERGQVSMLWTLPDGQQRRLLTMGAGTMVGALGFYLGMPQTASVITDQPLTYFRLTRDALPAMKRRDPALASALDELMIHLLAERLMSHNNKTTVALLQ
jgi:SulP family sulfate permease